MKDTHAHGPHWAQPLVSLAQFLLWGCPLWLTHIQRFLSLSLSRLWRALSWPPAHTCPVPQLCSTFQPSRNLLGLPFPSIDTCCRSHCFCCAGHMLWFLLPLTFPPPYHFGCKHPSDSEMCSFSIAFSVPRPLPATQWELNKCLLNKCVTMITLRINKIMSTRFFKIVYYSCNKK